MKLEMNSKFHVFEGRRLVQRRCPKRDGVKIRGHLRNMPLDPFMCKYSAIFAVVFPVIVKSGIGKN